MDWLDEFILDCGHSFDVQFIGIARRAATLDSFESFLIRNIHESDYVSSDSLLSSPGSDPDEVPCSPPAVLALQRGSHRGSNHHRRMADAVEQGDDHTPAQRTFPHEPHNSSGHFRFRLLQGRKINRLQWLHNVVMTNWPRVFSFEQKPTVTPCLRAFVLFRYFKEKLNKCEADYSALLNSIVDLHQFHRSTRVLHSPRPLPFVCFALFIPLLFSFETFLSQDFR